MNGGERETLRLLPTNNRASEYVTLPKDGSQRLEPGIGVGGPMMKDKLWFFASYLPSLETFERSTQFSNGTPVTREQSDDTQYFSANATSQLTNSTRGKIAYNSAKRTIEGVLPGRAMPGENGTTAATALLDTNDIRPNWSLSGDYNWVVNDKFFIGARGGYYKQDQYQRGHPVGDAVPVQRHHEHRHGRRAGGPPAPTQLLEHPDQPQRHAQHLRPRQLPGRWHLLRQLRRLAHDQGRRAVRPHRQRRARFRAEQPDPHQLESDAGSDR